MTWSRVPSVRRRAGGRGQRRGLRVNPCSPQGWLRLVPCDERSWRGCVAGLPAPCGARVASHRRLPLREPTTVRAALLRRCVRCRCALRLGVSDGTMPPGFGPGWLRPRSVGARRLRVVRRRVRARWSAQASARLWSSPSGDRQARAGRRTVTVWRSFFGSGGEPRRRSLGLVRYGQTL